MGTFDFLTPSKPLNLDRPLQIVIVGGLSAGPSAAARARRIAPHAKILMFEKGNDISYATCGIPYALSGEIPSLEDLNVVSPQLLETRFGIEVRLNEAVTDIDADRRIVRTTKGEYPFDTLVYAAGATAVVPQLPGLSETQNWSGVRTLEDTRLLMNALTNPAVHQVTIMGGGLIGCEVAENLQKKGFAVTVIEGSPELLSPWSPEFGHFASQVLEENGVTVIRNAMVAQIDRNLTQITGVILKDGRKIQSDYLIVSVGIRPNTGLLKDKGAGCLPNGALIVTDKMETSLPGIYAAGDCASVQDQLTGKSTYFPMGTHSNKGGRTAGTNAAGGTSTYKGGYGTGIVKIFDHVFARTGFHPNVMTKDGIPFETTLIIAPEKPGYMPHASYIWIQLYFEPITGKILGAEVAGTHGVDKRIDVLATAIYAGLTVDDLSELDLAYAPPFSPAKDPVIVAGHVAQNQKQHRFSAKTPAQLASLILSEDIQIIDVRTPRERQKYGGIPNAVPVLLEHLDSAQFSTEKTYVVYCQKGLRGYLATLKLKEMGLPQVANLAGGFEAWQRAGYPVASETQGGIKH